MEKLALNTIRQNLTLEIKKGTSIDLLDLINLHGDVIDYDVYLPTKKKNLQRPFVWTLQQKQELILSVLKGIKLPSISIIRYKEKTGRTNGVYQIIDGKQRISTLIDFYNGAFPIVFDGKNYYISDLDEQALRVIKYFYFLADIAYEYGDYKPISDEEKIKWFELINFAGTPQDIEHLNSLKA